MSSRESPASWRWGMKSYEGESRGMGVPGKQSSTSHGESCIEWLSRRHDDPVPIRLHSHGLGFPLDNRLCSIGRQITVRERLVTLIEPLHVIAAVRTDHPKDPPVSHIAQVKALSCRCSLCSVVVLNSSRHFYGFGCFRRSPGRHGWFRPRLGAR